jgi:UPF0176 protein
MITVAALYKFVRFDDPQAIAGRLRETCRTQAVKGTLLIATEGINGTIAGSAEAIETVIDTIRALPGCAGLDVKFSLAEALPFHRMKVRIKKEIVTLGVAGVDAEGDAGDYVEAKDWNVLISDPGTIVIDTRNDYEVVIGSFTGALDPKVKSFSQFPDWFRAHRDELGKAPKVAMFCTGGIRCEKSTAFLKAEGIEAVYHLKGGILKYLETVPAQDSLWQGECFVFDERVAVGQGLSAGTHVLCRACRMPLGPNDLEHEHYREGVQCHHCVGERGAEKREGYAERHRQVLLAAQRGVAHIGEAR